MEAWTRLYKSLTEVLETAGGDCSLPNNSDSLVTAAGCKVPAALRALAHAAAMHQSRHTLVIIPCEV